MGDLRNMTSMYNLTLSDQIGAQQMVFNQQMQMIKGGPSQMPTPAPQQVQSFNTQDRVAFSTPSILDLQNGPFASNTNMTKFFSSFYSNIQNGIMRTLAEYNQKISQHYQERQASSENASPEYIRTSNPIDPQAALDAEKANQMRLTEQEFLAASNQIKEYYASVSPERKNIFESLKKGLKPMEVDGQKKYRINELSRKVLQSEDTNSVEKLLAKNFLGVYNKARAQLLDAQRLGVQLPAKVKNLFEIDKESPPATSNTPAFSLSGNTTEKNFGFKPEDIKKFNQDISTWLSSEKGKEWISKAKGVPPKLM